MTARRGRLCATAAIASIVAVAGGCGGGPSAEETRAELRRWASAVDDVCRATREDIVASGDAQDLLELPRIAERAGDDVRAAIERIRRVPISEAARPRVRSFLDGLAKVEPLLSEMTRTTADGTVEQIGKLGLRLADATRVFNDRAEAAGLRECAHATHFDAVLDAFAAPVYAAQFARFELWFARALRRLGSSSPPTAPGYARDLRRFAAVLERAETRVDDLYVYRPNRAVEAADELQFALDAYEGDLNAVAEQLHGGRRVLTPAGAKKFNRLIAKRQRRLRRAIPALREAIGARPPAATGAEPQMPELSTA